MTVPVEFAEAVTFKLIDMGPGGGVLRSEHPALPGGAILAVLEPGYPESSLPDRRAACIEALHADFTELSTGGWDIL